MEHRPLRCLLWPCLAVPSSCFACSWAWGLGLHLWWTEHTVHNGAQQIWRTGGMENSMNIRVSG